MSVEVFGSLSTPDPKAAETIGIPPSPTITRRGLLSAFARLQDPSGVGASENIASEPVAHLPESAIGTLLAKEMPRRKLLRVIGNATRAIFGLMLVDNFVGEALSSSKNSTIEAYSQDTDYLFPDTFCLIFTGFGAMYPEQLAKGLSDTFGQYGQTAFIRYGNAQIDPESIADTIATYMSEGDASVHTGIPRQPRKTASLYGHSMGGIVAFEVAAVLKNKHDVDVRQVFLDCSPAQQQDVKSSMKRALVTLLDVSNQLHFHGGPILRGVLEAIDRVGEGAVTFEAITDRLAKGMPGHALPNETIQNQAGVIRASYAIIQQTSSKILADVPVYHLAPSNPNDDDTVDNTSARRSWAQIIKKFIQVDLIGTHHANPNENPRAYNATLQPIFESNKLQNITTVRQIYRTFLKGQRTTKFPD